VCARPEPAPQCWSARPPSATPRAPSWPAPLTFHDVTERTQLEHSTPAGPEDGSYGPLAGGVAHDFNNLLTVIGGYGQMVRDALDPKSPLRRDIEAILEASESSVDADAPVAHVQPPPDGGARCWT